MKLPDECPFVILMPPFAAQPAATLTDDFIEWLVRDCAKVASEAAHKHGGYQFAKHVILTRYGLEDEMKEES